MSMGPYMERPHRNCSLWYEAMHSLVQCMKRTKGRRSIVGGYSKEHASWVAALALLARCSCVGTLCNECRKLISAIM